MYSRTGLPLDTMYPSLNFMLLARCARSLPDTITSQPFAPAQQTTGLPCQAFGKQNSKQCLPMPEELEARTAFHHEAQHSVAGAAHSQATQQLVAHGLRLCHSAQPAVGDLRVNCAKVTRKMG